MDTNHHNQLRQKAAQHKLSPRENTWFRLEAKLEKSKYSGKIKYYKNLSVAAVLLALICVMSIFILEKNMNTKAFEDASEVYSAQLQLLHINTDDDIYNVSKLRSLKEAYKKLSTKGKI